MFWLSCLHMFVFQSFQWFESKDTLSLMIQWYELFMEIYNQNSIHGVMSWHVHFKIHPNECNFYVLCRNFFRVNNIWPLKVVHLKSSHKKHQWPLRVECKIDICVIFKLTQHTYVCKANSHYRRTYIVLHSNN